MNWVVQGTDEQAIQASAAEIWAILEDGPRLAEWMPIVKETTGGREVVGAERTCRVEYEGQRGEVTERCVEHVAGHRIAWLLVKDSLGFGRLLSDFGFSFTLEARGPRSTVVRNETYYRPRGVVARVLNALIMRRKFRRVRMLALQNLRRLAEASEASASEWVAAGALQSFEAGNFARLGADVNDH